RPPRPTLFPYTTLFRSMTYKCSVSYAVRKIRFAVRTGEEWPAGSAVFQITFLDGPNSDGRSVVSETPKAFGPRNRGQSAASAQRSEEHTSELQSPCNLV